MIRFDQARRTVLMAAVVLSTASLLSTASPAQLDAQRRATRSTPTAWDREVQRLHGEVVRRGAHEDAIVPLIELGSAWQMAPARTLTLMHALGENGRLLPLLRAYARAYEASLLRRAGSREEAQRVSESLGYVRNWRVLGPFDNEGKRGFATVYAPESSLDAERDLDAEVPGLERPVRWTTLPDLGAGETVPLDPFFTPSSGVCVYAETFVQLERAEQVALLASTSGAFRLWWNGQQVLEDSVYRGADTDRDAVLVDGRLGWNRVLMKVCSDERGLALLFRVARPDGSPMRVLADSTGATRAAAASATTASARAASATSASAPTTFLAALEASVAAHPDDAAAHEALARYLDYTHGEDTTTHRARDLIDRAVTLRPSAGNLVFAARLQSTRADRMRLLDQAVALAPRDPQVAFAHAVAIWEGPGGERALRMLEAIAPSTHSGLSAMVIRARIIAELGMPQSAHAIYEDIARRVPASPFYLSLLAGSESTRGHRSRVSELRRQVLAIQPEHLEMRRGLVDEAIARADREAVLTLVSDEVERYPVSRITLGWAASAYDAVGAETEAIDVLRRATDLDPGDAGARVALGRTLLRHGHRDAALSALREAITLRPQDAATRRLLEQVEPQERTDEALATAIETILTRRQPDGQHSSTILHDLEVHTVHESGLASRFRQVVTQIHDDEGARRQRSFGFTYEPSSQWVEVRMARVLRGGQELTSFRMGERALAEPAYRIYYSARQVVVTFPVLEPGDVVEIRYRVEDVAARNAYADYFGAMRPLQSTVPVMHLEQVFYTPSTRRFFFHAPQPLVQHSERIEGATRIVRFAADQIPALRPEPGMPGYAEVAPYLHVTTFETWEQVGRFWWGLVTDQIRPDAALERTVRDLIAGASSTRERVARIYAWATDHVRYVGLEFGIHGHQPYRITDVVERGYGDCKDTAALLYAMLQIAGIDARIALVRTTQMGNIETQTASLAVFNHAIAYVPELDLFLDGTAEHSGIAELPEMDQGGLALVVGPDEATLRELPRAGADTSGRSRELTITLSPDGSAALHASEELRGQDAMTARGTFEAPGTRRERLSRGLAALFPGIEVQSESFEALDERERPVRYEWTATAPSVGERDGEVLRIAPAALGGLTRAWASLPTRSYPLVLPASFRTRERRVLVLGSLSARDVPQGGVAESPFGRLSVRYSRRGADVIADTELALSRDRVSPAEYAEFRRWVEAADALLRQRITIGGAR